jgi:hypothetical protein
LKDGLGSRREAGGEAACGMSWWLNAMRVAKRSIAGEIRGDDRRGKSIWSFSDQGEIE